MRRQRVTVILNALDLEVYADEERREYLSEWVHPHNYSQNELGVTLEWPALRVEVFAPWSSVLKVERGPCYCDECTEAMA